MTRDPDRRPKHAAGDGEVPPWWRALDRRHLAVALGSTFVAVPVVVFDNLPRHQEARAQAEEVAAVDASTTTTAGGAEPVVVALAAPTTTATTAAPTTTATTAAPATTAPPPPPTTTTAPPPPPTTTTAPPPAPSTSAGSESGKASWYRWRDGECAHKTLPRGTVVTATNVANGRSATCVVTDRGPYGDGRIIDLDDGTFSQLAPLSAGVIDVTITW